MGVEIRGGLEYRDQRIIPDVDGSDISQTEPLLQGGRLGPAFVYVPAKVAYHAMNAVDRVVTDHQKDHFQNLRAQLQSGRPIKEDVKAKPGELVLMQVFLAQAIGAERNCDSIFTNRAHIIELENLSLELQKCRRHVARSILHKDIG